MNVYVLVLHDLGFVNVLAVGELGPVMARAVAEAQKGTHADDLGRTPSVRKLFSRGVDHLTRQLREHGAVWMFELMDHTTLTVFEHALSAPVAGAEVNPNGRS